VIDNARDRGTVVFMMTVEVARPTQAQTSHPLTLTVDVDPSWVKDLTERDVVFHRRVAGYWLRGVRHDAALGWLCYELPRAPEDVGRDDLRVVLPEEDAAALAWSTGGVLPPGWHRLDRTAALRAWEAGVRRWGVDWYCGVDARREDSALQIALLGEVQYEYDFPQSPRAFAAHATTLERVAIVAFIRREAEHVRDLARVVSGETGAILRRDVVVLESLAARVERGEYLSTLEHSR
jgi:hypothetical protein